MQVGALVVITFLLFVVHLNATSIQVNTTYGEIVGNPANEIIYFFGIPYAAPPTGNLRWKPPQPTTPWTSPLSAYSPGADCVQPLFSTPNLTLYGSEDCLYLNVYAPDTDAENLPIMIWIHGGGFEEGSANSIDMQHVVKQGNVIVFSIAYRMGPFANLAQRDLLATGGSANIMLLDQQFAIKWIYDNAAAFGGDQSSITIWGESAGGASVLLQALMPENKGIVTRVISESGAALQLIELEQALNIGDMFTETVGCNDASSVYDCLMTLSPNEINRAIPETTYFLLGRGAFWTPIVDDDVLTAQPLLAYAAGDYYVNQFLFGTNLNEGNGFVGGYYNWNFSMSEATFNNALEWWFPTEVESIANQYQNLSVHDTYLVSLADLLTDMMFLCPVQYVANMVNTDNTFVYVFTETNPAYPYLGSYHALELGYVFGNWEYSQSTPFTPAQQQLSNSMVGYWTNFAASGNPNVGQSNSTAAVRWPLWSGEDDREIMVLAAPPFDYAEYRTQFCDFWSELYSEGIFCLVRFPNTTATAHEMIHHQRPQYMK